MSKFKYKLGLKVKDKITGFKGIIVSRLQFLFGCNQYGVRPQKLEKGEPIDAHYIDEGRIKIIGKGIAPKEVRVKVPGCDNHPDAPKE